jgi:hypothetical protein
LDVEERYLLSCRCGRELPVNRRQAGETVHCQCGALLEVPTLRRLTSLPRADEPAPAAPPSGDWGWRHRLWLLGTVVCVLAVVPMIILLVRFPTPPRKIIPPAEHVRQEAQSFSATQAWLVWRQLENSKIDVVRVTDQMHFPEAEHAYGQIAFKYQLGIAVLALFCALGLGMIVTGLLQKP